MREKQATKLQDVSWHGAMVPVRNEKVRVFLIHVQDSRSEVERAETHEACMELYDGILSESQQAVQSIQEDIKAENSVREIVYRCSVLKSLLQRCDLRSFALMLGTLTHCWKKSFLAGLFCGQTIAFSPSCPYKVVFSGF